MDNTVMADKDVILSVQEIKDGGAKVLEEWFDSEQENEEQVKEALRDEGIHVESAFINESDDERDLLYYYIEGDDLEEALEEFKESDHENIQQYQVIVEQTLVGGLDAYHANQAERLFHVVIDEDAR